MTLRARSLVAALLVAASVGCESTGAPGAQTAEIVADAAPDDLADTGLYVDVAQKTLSPRARPFTPAVALWSDGAEKQRWIDLPDGQTIDVSAPDDWTFPVGTKAWKEFRVGGRRVETRFWWKVRADRWLAASYVWSDDEARATRGEGRTVDVAGRPYAVPTSNACSECHRGKKDRLLGFEAVNLGLDGATGATLATLAAEGKLAPAPAATHFTIADDGTGKASPALAWLHVNCGVSCHAPNPNASGYPIGLRLRLDVGDLTSGRPPSEWASLQSAIGVPAKNPDEDGQLRIAPGDPDASLLLARISAVGQARMPPTGSDVVDTEHVALVRGWIAALPRPPSPTPPMRAPMHLPMPAQTDATGL